MRMCAEYAKKRLEYQVHSESESIKLRVIDQKIASFDHIATEIQAGKEKPTKSKIWVQQPFGLTRSSYSCDCQRMTSLK